MPAAEAVRSSKRVDDTVPTSVAPAELPVVLRYTLYCVASATAFHVTRTRSQNSASVAITPVGADGSRHDCTVMGCASQRSVSLLLLLPSVAESMMTPTKRVPVGVPYGTVVAGMLKRMESIAPKSMAL